MSAIKAINLIFICFMISSIICIKIDSKASLLQTTGRIRVTADNSVKRVTVNGVALNISLFPNSDIIRNLDTVSIPLKTGDVVAITALNSGTYNDRNPGYIIAEIIWSHNTNGVLTEQKIVSNTNDWQCHKVNSSTLKAEGTNSVCSYGTTPYGYVYLTNTAEGIWTCDLSIMTVECEVKLEVKSLRPTPPVTLTPIIPVIPVTPGIEIPEITVTPFIPNNPNTPIIPIIPIPRDEVPELIITKPKPIPTPIPTPIPFYPKNGEVRVNVNDFLRTIKVNGVELQIEKYQIADGYDPFNRASFPLRQGDVVVISGGVVGEYSEENRGHIYGEITWYDELEMKQRVTTDLENWKCFKINVDTKIREDKGSIYSFGLSRNGVSPIITGGKGIWSCDLSSSYVECEVKLGVRNDDDC